jgi:NAD(P)H dehydrogenase (quinone)
MKIAITGATGQLGRIVVQKLKAKGENKNIVAIVRSKQKAEDLGIEAREADYDKPELLDIALSNIDTLVLISSSEVGKRAIQHKNVINAAKKAGVKHIVYTSLLHADRSSLGLAGEHIETEEALKNAGIPYTILRNGWYTENYENAITSAQAMGAFFGSAGRGKISAAPRADYAEAIVSVVTSEGHIGKTYELGGDDAFTLKQLAEEVSRQTGKELPYTDLPSEEYRDLLLKAGLPEPIAHMLVGIDVSISMGDLYDSSHQLSKLIGHPTTPLQNAIAKLIK